ncbi:MAG: 2-oxoglutarate oxidoreductase subunit KorA [Syntrophorhabdus sp. PtaU1.Bin153]|nr:MAG: 2-oxoglutarate oxidoreductase subunit KorA [Syntrophorhabdus sp. PtaU1.Bin153]
MITTPNQTQLMQGNQAMTHGALYAGARFYAGYPITPSSEIAEECSVLMPKLGGMYIQMEDEIASIAAVVGASLAGAKAFTATSGPGFSLMQENLGFAVMAEVPCVVINVQRSGPSTGLATKPAQADVMQARWGRHGDQSVVALCPSTVAECFGLTVQAFNFSEKYRIPVILVADEVVAHMREGFRIPEDGEVTVIERKRPTCHPRRYKPFETDIDGVAPLASYGSDYVFHVSSSMHGPDGFSNNDPVNATRKIEQLHRKVEFHRDEIVITRSFDIEDADVLLVAYGITARAARAAALAGREAGIKAGVLQLLTLWPFADKEIGLASERVQTIIVPEMNYAGQVAGEVQKVVGPDRDIRRVNRYNGQIITPDDILEVMTR